MLLLCAYPPLATGFSGIPVTTEAMSGDMSGRKSASRPGDNDCANIHTSMAFHLLPGVTRGLVLIVKSGAGRGPVEVLPGPCRRHRFSRRRENVSTSSVLQSEFPPIRFTGDSSYFKNAVICPTRKVKSIKVHCECLQATSQGRSSSEIQGKCLRYKLGKMLRGNGRCIDFSPPIHAADWQTRPPLHTAVAA